MADDSTSQGNFIGWLGLGLIVFALLCGLFVALAGMSGG